jgi:hypothetical protein
MLVCAGAASLTGCGADTGDDDGYMQGGTSGTATGPIYQVGQQIDTNGDGSLDGVAIDSNNDGCADQVDTTGDNVGDFILNNNCPSSGGTTGGGTGSSTMGTTGGSSGGTSGGETSGGGSGGTTAPGDDVATPGDDRNTSVSCGGMLGAEIPCDLASESCCVTGFASDAATCHAGTACTAGTGNRAVCDGPEDCSGGQVCCVDIVNGTTACINAATCPLTAPFQMCHSDADCPAGQTCGSEATFKWWGYCS